MNTVDSLQNVENYENLSIRAQEQISKGRSKNHGIFTTLQNGFNRGFDEIFKKIDSIAGSSLQQAKKGDGVPLTFDLISIGISWSITHLLIGGFLSLGALALGCLATAAIVQVAIGGVIAIALLVALVAVTAFGVYKNETLPQV